MNKDINYKNKKRYNTAKYPIRQPLFIVGLIWVLSKILLIGKKYKLEKINMEGLKPPYILLSNHMYFIDFELAALLTFPHRVNNVVNIDGYYRRAWLMELIGAICTRKFVMDMHLIRSIKKVLKRGDILCMYPEARYSPCGITSYIPDSVGSLVKMNKVPVVTIVHHGNYLHTPFWNFRNKRKVPLYTTMTQLLTAEDVKNMTAAEINEAIRKGLDYNEYKYQKDNGIKIKEKYRAEGLHKILYQCPSCKTEHEMDSKGCEIFCTHCGKRWYQNEDGTLKALNGETEFDHIPDWYNWEREQVRLQIERGEYSFYDEVEIYSMPRAHDFTYVGFGKLTHDPERGFIVSGEHNGEEFYIQRTPLQTNSLHIEYDYCYLKPFDCVDISTENDSLYCYPQTRKNVVTKLGFATEILYQKNIDNTIMGKKTLDRK